MEAYLIFSVKMKRKLTEREKDLLRGIRHSSNPGHYYDTFYKGYGTAVALKRI